MYDWTDYTYESARLTFPRLSIQIDAISRDSTVDALLDLLMSQNPRSFQC